MYMNNRWNHDDEYFQRMIEWERRVENEDDPVAEEVVDETVDEVVGAVITNMHALMEDESGSDTSSMPGLQERGQEDSSSSDGSSMPLLQDRALEDSSSDDDLKLYDEDGIYSDGEHCVYRAPTLKQIISTNWLTGVVCDGRFQCGNVALFKYSLLSPTLLQTKCSAHHKADFRQAKE